MKIYTKTGDDGTTSLFSGGRVSKTHLRVEAYGAVDELNAALGWVRTHQPTEQTTQWLARIQGQLFQVGADLATPLDAQTSRIVRVNEAAIEWLESVIDEVDSQLPALKTFILPGGTPAAAMLHVARTVCRRAERRVIQLAESEAIGERVGPYLNRLSDLLFMLARWENHQAGVADEPWPPAYP